MSRLLSLLKTRWQIFLDKILTTPSRELEWKLRSEVHWFAASITCKIIQSNELAVESASRPAKIAGRQRRNIHVGLLTLFTMHS